MADPDVGETPDNGEGQPTTSRVHLAKATETLRGAELELANGLYNNALNRAYYACYQAAVAALVAEGVTSEPENYWPHDLVQAKFAALLIDELQTYPPSIRATLKAVFDERLKADYEPVLIDVETAGEAVLRARAFVHLVAKRVDAR